MRYMQHKRDLRSTSAPVYTFDTDVGLDRVIRDPLTVLLGRSKLSTQNDSAHHDPYNRVGRFMRAR